MGCILPGSPNVTSFWNNLLAGKSQISPLPRELFNYNLYYDHNTPKTDKMCSINGGIIDSSIIDGIKQNLDLNYEFNRTHILSLGAFDQAYRMLDSKKLSSYKCGFILALMFPDTEFYNFYREEEKVYAEIDQSNINSQSKINIQNKLKKYFEQYHQRQPMHPQAVFSTSLIHQIQKRYNLKGESAIMNAACAGSLAAINSAVLQLKNDNLDIVFTGGIHSSIIPSLFIIFSEMQILSPNICLPFDSSSKGVSLGEGSVILAIRRLGKALADGHQILGIIKGIGHSNNGSDTGLFSLNKTQLLRAYESAYASLENNEIDYLEAHGAGTPLGDRTELESIGQFWKNSSIKTGSAKFIVGHTQGAAGAVGLLKCLLMAQNNIITPSSYLSQTVIDQNNVSINTIPISLSKEKRIRFGISSLGFGGCNYHLILEKFTPNTNVHNVQIFDHHTHPSIKKQFEMVELNSVCLSINELSNYDFVNHFRFSPEQISRIDKIHLYALLATDLAIKSLGGTFNCIDKEKVGVIYAGINCSELSYNATTRLQFIELIDLLKDSEPMIMDKIISLKNTYPSITSDFAPGALSNVVAGRICQKFNFTGKSYQVDSDYNGLALALKMAEWELLQNLDLIILVNTDYFEETAIHKYRKNVHIKPAPKNITSHILSSKTFAKNNALKIQSTIDGIIYNINTNLNKSFGQYSGYYQIQSSKYSDIDFSNCCFIFSTQNSAIAKMFVDTYLKNSLLQDFFKTANDYCSQQFNLPNLSIYLTNPSGLSEKDLSTIKNPALFTIQVALAKVLIENGINPKILTGHSFGIFAALVVAGILEFKDGLDIVINRDCFSPAPNTLGTMLSIPSIADIDKILEEKKDYFISNLNGPQQTAISISPSSWPKTIQILKDNNIFYSILNEVPQPYHSPLMESVQNKMQDYLNNKNFKFNPPNIPIFSYVENQLIDNKNYHPNLITNILIKQTTAQVNFTNIIENIYETNVPTFIEIGAKNICSKFISNILKEKNHTVLPVNHFLNKDDGPIVKYYITAENSKIFDTVRKIIHKTTGHLLESISIQDKYQENLNIDSIEIAEIFIKISKEYDIDDDDFLPSNFKVVGETVNFIKDWCTQKISGTSPKTVKYVSDFNRYKLTWKWKEKISLPPLGKHSNIFIIDLEDDPANILKELNRALVFENTKQPNQLSLIIFNGIGLTKEFNSDNFNIYYQNILFPIIIEFQNFLKKKSTELSKPTEFKILTTIYNNEYNPFIQGLISFLNSISFELNGFFSKSILISNKLSAGHNINTPKTLEVIMPLIVEESLYPLDRDVAYIHHRRMIRTIKKTNIHKQITPNQLNNIVAIGGTRGITFHLLNNLHIANTSSHLYLLGRSSKDHPKVKTAIDKLSSKYKQITYIQGNSTNWSSFNQLASQLSEIDLLINGAGIETSVLLREKIITDIQQELDTKILTTLNILKFSDLIKIKQVVNFSSIVALYGHGGQSSYSAANAIMSALSHQLKIISPQTTYKNIYWPAWNNLGMTAKEGISAKTSQSGLSLLDTDKAVAFFNKDIAESNNNNVSNSSDHDITYLDIYDCGLYQINSHLIVYFEKLLGNKNLYNLYEFNKIFNNDCDSYLQGHVISGKSIVPMATIATMCAANFYLQTGEYPCLKNLQANQMINLDDNINIRFISQKNNKGIKYILKNNKTIYFSALAQPSLFPQKIVLVDSKIFDLKESKTILKKDIYEKILPHREIFQCLDRIVLKEKHKIVGYLSTEKLAPIHSLGIFDKLILLIDAILQVNGIFCYTEYNCDSYPIEIENINFNLKNIVPSELLITNISSSKNETIFRSELNMFDLQNNLLINLTVKCRIVEVIYHGSLATNT